jgi:NAD(P)H-nitrite reductase large subunit
VCGETFWGVTPPELCPACGAGWDQFVEVVVHDDQEIEKIEYEGHILVVGAGAAAISAVNTIRKHCTTCKITIVTAENEYPYYRPSVSDGIGNLSVFEKPEFLLHPPEWYEENNVRLLIGKRAEELDTQAKTARIMNAETMEFEEEIEFDRLIMAVGSRCWSPMKDFVGTYSNVFTIRVPDEVRRIREYMDKHDVKKICFVGAGILALEAASEMAELKAEVHMVELADRVLPMQIDEDGSKIMCGVLEKKNVHLHLTTVVADIHASEGCVTSLTLKNGEEVDTDVVIVAVGVRSNLELLLASQNIKCVRAIQVDDHMATSAPDVFACGDCCEWNGKYIASWPSAQAQGEVAGGNVIGLASYVFKGVSFPYFMDAFDTNIFSVGDVNPKGDLPMIRLMDPTRKQYKKVVFNEEGKASGVILMGDMSLAVSMETAVNAGWSMKDVMELLSE